MLKRSTVFCILYFILVINLYAQRSRISFERISIEQGLSQSTITCIIHRHGGIIWVEGKVNEGATFYFTLK